MIFVSMNNEDNELLLRTVNYRVHYELVDDIDDDIDDDSYAVNFVSDPASAWSDSESSPEPAQVESLEPNATFSHQDRKTKCVITFEPAMYVEGPERKGNRGADVRSSGRYILAKFFSTPGQKNIDIGMVPACCLPKRELTWGRPG